MYKGLEYFVDSELNSEVWGEELLAQETSLLYLGNCHKADALSSLCENFYPRHKPFVLLDAPPLSLENPLKYSAY